jgi:hypothetical protein
MDWVRPYVGEWGGVTVGDSTSHTAFHLAERLGCDPIVLIGQDLAYTGGKTHAAGVATRADSGSEAGQLMVPAFDGGEVATSQSLFTILKHFEAKIAASRAKVINATEGGARLEGAEPMRFSEALERHAPEAFDVRGPIEGALRRRPMVRVAALREEARSLRLRAARARGLSHRGIRLMRRLFDFLCESAPKESLLEGFEELDRVYADLQRDHRLMGLLQPGFEGALLRLRWPEASPGVAPRQDLLDELLKDRRLFAELCLAARDIAHEMRTLERAVGGEDAPASRLSDGWLRQYAAALSRHKGERKP